MHPPLAPTGHPHCAEAIESLQFCHKENPYAKFWGVCNEKKVLLDKCFKEEKALKRELNKQRNLAKKKKREEYEAKYGKL